MKKILLPTDFSKNAFNAVTYAVNLFREEECTFYLLNTYTPILYDSDFVLYNSSTLSMDEIYHQNSLKGLSKVEERVKAEFPKARHTYEKIASFSLLNEAIKSQIEEKKIDLVVMGTQGATGAEQILFGTHTVNAINKVTCPLLAIPSGYSFRRPKNILFPTDYDINYTPQHLNILLEISLLSESTIQILHVSFGLDLQPEQQKSRELLKAYLRDVPHQVHLLEENTVPLGIYKFQDEQVVDMMIMVSNKHSFFENLLFRPVINEIGFNLKIPLLVIPSGKWNK